eukprot:8588387-Pyramimonas_sp.AAC.1
MPDENKPLAVARVSGLLANPKNPKRPTLLGNVPNCGVRCGAALARDGGGVGEGGLPLLQGKSTPSVGASTPSAGASTASADESNPSA